MEFPLNMSFGLRIVFAKQIPNETRYIPMPELIF
jgi:hypothetical protein